MGTTFLNIYKNVIEQYYLKTKGVFGRGVWVILFEYFLYIYMGEKVGVNVFKILKMLLEMGYETGHKWVNNLKFLPNAKY